MPLPRRSAALLSVLMLALAACSTEDAPEQTAADPDTACAAAPNERMAKALLRCTETSVVQVITDYSTGTGVVVESDDRRYIVTNVHVVDPFRNADIAVRATRVDDVPVVGVDATSDIAVLGPIDDDSFGPALPLADGTDLERGDEVFLVGFPGETDESDELESTISSGIVSRLRSLDEYDQSYIQTDASIAGGQSGGPLFDGRGRLVGISGLSFADEFALALSATDVSEVIERIVSGGGDEYLALPTSAEDTDARGATEGSLEFADAGVMHSMYLPPAATKRDFEFTIDAQARPLVLIEAFQEDEPLAISLEAVDIQQELLERLAERNGGDPEQLPDDSALGQTPRLQAAQVGPGSFRVTLPVDQPINITISAPLLDAATSLSWRASLPVLSITPALRIQPLEIGETLDQIVSGFETGVQVEVELTAGERYELHARSPQSDVGFTLIEPGIAVDPVLLADPDVEGVENVDDTEDGLYGLDARSVYEAPTTGTYRIRLYHNDGTTVAVRFSVRDCAEAGTQCDGNRDDVESEDDTSTTSKAGP